MDLCSLLLCNLYSSWQKGLWPNNSWNISFWLIYLLMENSIQQAPFCTLYHHTMNKGLSIIWVNRPFWNLQNSFIRHFFALANAIIVYFLALKRLVAEYESLKVASGPRKRDWANRMTVLEESWASRRQEIFSYVVKNERPTSGKCNLCFEKDVKVACSSCDSLENRFLCHSCDFHVHEMLPFHKRTSSAGGFKARLSPSTFIGENGKDVVEKGKCIYMWSSIVSWNPEKGFIFMCIFAMERGFEIWKDSSNSWTVASLLLFWQHSATFRNRPCRH